MFYFLFYDFSNHGLRGCLKSIVFKAIIGFIPPPPLKKGGSSPPVAGDLGGYQRNVS